MFKFGLLNQFTMLSNLLQGKKVLITAGPTREAIDPVRFISNHSTGKMAYAIAAECLEQGAEVILISGPVCLSIEHPRLLLKKVNSAMDMYLTCCRHFEEADVCIFAAAVADYRPAQVSEIKIKKDAPAFSIEMVKNVDIAYEFGRIKTSRQLSVGFALETNDEEQNAASKLERKNFDMIVLNSLNDAGAGFGTDTNKISIIRHDYSITEYPLKTKREAAEDIVYETGILLSLARLKETATDIRTYETMLW